MHATHTNKKTTAKRLIDNIDFKPPKKNKQFLRFK